MSNGQLLTSTSAYMAAEAQPFVFRNSRSCIARVRHSRLHGINHREESARPMAQMEVFVYVFNVPTEPVKNGCQILWSSKTNTELNL